MGESEERNRRSLRGTKNSRRIKFDRRKIGRGSAVESGVGSLVRGKETKG